MARIVMTETIHLSETEVNAINLFMSILEGVSRESECPEIVRICDHLISYIGDLWEYIEIS